MKERQNKRPFQSSCLSPLQSESKCEAFVMVISSYLHITETIFVRKAAHPDSLWGRARNVNMLLSWSVSTLLVSRLITESVQLYSWSSHNFTKSELDKSVAMAWEGSPAQSQMSLFLEHPFPRTLVAMFLKKHGRTSHLWHSFSVASLCLFSQVKCV